MAKDTHWTNISRGALIRSALLIPGKLDEKQIHKSKDETYDLSLT